MCIAEFDRGRVAFIFFTMEHLAGDEVLPMMTKLTAISSNFVANVELVDFARQELLQKCNIHFINYNYGNNTEDNRPTETSAVRVKKN